MKPKNTAPETETNNEVSITLVPLEHLLAHPELKNRPIDKQHATELYDSISRNGLDTPLFTWNGGEEDAKMEVGGEQVPANYLIAGFHRRDALRQFRKADEKKFLEVFPDGKIPVRRFSGNLADMIALQVRENANRKDPSLPELLPQLQKLRDVHKLKSVQIARKIGRSEAWVSRVFSLLDEGGDEAVQAAQEGKLSFREAMAVTDEIKKAKKEGKPLSKEEKTEKVKKAVAKSSKSKGRGKSEKRLSAKGLYGRYKAMPKVNAGRKLTILEESLAYLAGESDDLPAELQREEKKEKKSKED